ncbi:MAG: lipoyl synthase [Myxococcota bacterium]|nr:lipoyl synthase [Myxococcota bacterium]
MTLSIHDRKPPWLKVRPPGGERYTWIREQRVGLGLATVCEEARCPNIGECWSEGTATFMVMGPICTRGCRFCAVTTRKSGTPLDPLEPQKLGETIKAMDLDYIVVTSVDRDDLPDEGAGHFAACVKAVNRISPKTRVEILHPDFSGRMDLVDVVVQSGADVLAHNIETVRRLTPQVRDRRAGYDQSLAVLQRVKETDPSAVSKSSIMVGLGETEAEVVECMRDLREVGVDLLTLGQYLRPSAKHIAVEEYVSPDQFERYGDLGRDLGFLYVASGPLVRSSYRAGEVFVRSLLDDRPGFGKPAALGSSSRLKVVE